MCAVPAFRALRTALPEAKITLIGLPWAQSFVERFSDYIDEFVPFGGYPGIPEAGFDAATSARFFTEMQERHFDLAIQMHGNGIVANAVVALLGARSVAGFYLPGQFCPDPDLFIEYPSHESERERMLRLTDHLGAPRIGEQGEFPTSDEDRREWRELSRQHGLRDKAFACIHPGARDEARRWSVEGFAKLADGLARTGLSIVFTGVDEEADVIGKVRRLMQYPSVDLTGATSLGGLGCLLKHAGLVVSNDTGIRHLADALNVPSIVIFTRSDPARWAPAGPQRVLVESETPGNACLHSPELGSAHRCLGDSCGAVITQHESAETTRLTPERVLAEAEDLLSV
jgi:ADP-heptose:LPS heptosyltransferase